MANFTSQTLATAFFLGILLQAAAGSLLVHSSGHGSKLLQEGRRLALIIFFLFVILWALTEWLNLFVRQDNSSLCQVGVGFSTAFDQLARLGMEQFLVWSTSRGARFSMERVILQAILLARLVVGGILVGFARPDFAPACVVQNAVMPIAIVALSLDFLIIGLVFGLLSIFRVLTGVQGHEKRSLSVVVAGSIVWEGTSVIMLLGLPKEPLLFRTLLPIFGLLMLIYIVTALSSTLRIATVNEIAPEAQSPSEGLGRFHQQAHDGSPVIGRAYSNSRSLFIVNPSTTPFDSPIQPRDSKAPLFNRSTIEVSVRPTFDESEILSVSTNGINPENKSSSTTTRRSMNVGHPEVVPIINTPAKKGKRSLFGRTKPPSQAMTRGLNISGPVMVAGQESLDPLSRMQTIDLATAAALDRERRRQAAARAQQSDLSQSPIQQSSATLQDALQKSVSIKRKAVTPGSGKSTSASAMKAATLAMKGQNATSTSMSLSPGHEDVRRRSPRTQEDFKQIIDEKETRQSSTPRRLHSGLPTNPRHHMARHPAQTVMLLRDIIYDDPATVNKIIAKTPGRSATTDVAKASKERQQVSNEGTLKSSGPVIHRPRPYGKKNSHRGIFPDEKARHHRRSRSDSSISSLRMCRTMDPDSPIDGPTLPAPPTTAANLTRIFSEDTKSLTVDEKIELLFPLPPIFPVEKERRLSAPLDPPLPLQKTTDLLPESYNTEHRENGASRASRISGLRNITKKVEGDEPMIEQVSRKSTVRDSARADQSLAAENAGDAHVQSHTQGGCQTSISQQAKVQDAKNIERKSAWAGTLFDDTISHPESTPLQMPLVTASVSLNTVDRLCLNRGSSDIHPSGMSGSKRSQIDSPTGGEIMTLMLDTAPAEIISHVRSETLTRRSEQNDALSWRTTHAPSEQPWHRRIGDKLPTFSDPRADRRSRKMPPPKALYLKSKSTTNPVVVQQIEVSPLESPERALQEIQAQLQHFEIPERVSPRASLRFRDEKPSIKIESHSTKRGRSSLLSSLEDELGQQESYWQRLHQTLDRDSMSTVASRPASIGSETIPLQELPRLKVIPLLPHTDVVRARFKDKVSSLKGSTEPLLDISASTPKRNHLGDWQRRLAEAESEYLERAPNVLCKQNMNFFTMPRAGPTPPDSEADTTSEPEPELQRPAELSKTKAMLWGSTRPPPTRSRSLLWDFDLKPITPTVLFSETPALGIRSAKRLPHRDMSIESSNLWSKPRIQIELPFKSLWRPKDNISDTNGPPRPRSVTQRPPRRFKRITALPDIVENPVPVPNKRDTLGIFQYPWGETSDSAEYQPVFNPALISGPLLNAAQLNANLERRSRQLEAREARLENSKSFFEEYEDEDMDLDEVDPESDDDFDESTLWEIANLLKSNEVPSKNSLLLPASLHNRSTEPEDSDSEYEEEATLAVQYPEVKFPIMPLTKYNAVGEMGLLWHRRMKGPTSAMSYGLPEVEPSKWRLYLDCSQSTGRSRPRVAAKVLDPLTTADLWTASGQDQIRHDWLSQLHIQPTSPIVHSIDSSAKSSPISEISEASSVESASSTASIILNTNGATPAWWDRVGLSRGMRSPVAPDSTESISQISIRHPADESRASVTESKVLDPRNLGKNHTSMTGGDVTKNAFKVSPTRDLQLDTAIEEVITSDGTTAINDPMTKSEDSAKMGSLKASKENWEESLAQVIAASKLGTSHVEASSADQDWALAKAVTSAYPTQGQHGSDRAMLQLVPLTRDLASNAPNKYPLAAGRAKPTPLGNAHLSPATCHPVFLGITMSSCTCEPHPAAVGYIKQHIEASSFDPATRHPALFVKSFRTAGPHIHPVATGHFQTQPIDLDLWRSSGLWDSTARSQRYNSILTDSERVPGATDLFVHIKHTRYYAKRPSPTRSATPQYLVSNYLFRPWSNNASSRHWLHTTSSTNSNLQAIQVPRGNSESPPSQIDSASTLFQLSPLSYSSTTWKPTDIDMPLAAINSIAL